LIEENRFSGVRLTPLAQMRGASEILGPGRVSYWLSEDRLNELRVDPTIR
jgi:hypothetical protein